MDDWKIALAASRLPEGMHGGIERWIEPGIRPGSFLSAVLRNDLRTACEKADDTNRYLLFEYVSFFYNHAPSSCWGSPEKFAAWMEYHASLRAKEGA